MRRGIVIVLTLALVAGLSSSSANAQVLPENHYLVYDVYETHGLYVDLWLYDQFGDYWHDWINIDKFANPVEKNGEPMWDPLVHMTWWQIWNPVEPCNERLVGLENQFGRQDWLLKDGLYLLTAARKDEPGIPPPTWNHYECYEVVQGDPLGIQVVLSDQFGTYTAQVMDPVLFCNPCTKVADGVQYPVIYPEVHLACYLLDPPLPEWGGLHYATDQFGNWSVTILEPCWLCVPSLKLTVIGIEKDTWGGVKNLFR